MQDDYTFIYMHVFWSKLIVNVVIVFDIQVEAYFSVLKCLIQLGLMTEGLVIDLGHDFTAATLYKMLYNAALRSVNGLTKLANKFLTL